MDILLGLVIFCCLVPLAILAFLAQQLIRNINNTNSTFKSLIEEMNGANTKKVSKKKSKVVKKSKANNFEEAEFREIK